MKINDRNIGLITILCLISCVCGAILSGFTIPNFDHSALSLLMMFGGGIGTIAVPLIYWTMKD